MKDGSRKEERMMILNMVAEGKVSVDESLKLLEALNAGKAKNEEFTYDYNYNYDFEEKVSRFSKSVDDFARDMGEKLSGTFKDVEPKVRKATKTVVQKTVSVLDDISSSLNETLKNLDENDNEPLDNGPAPEACEEAQDENKDDDNNTPIPN